MLLHVNPDCEDTVNVELRRATIEDGLYRLAQERYEESDDTLRKLREYYAVCVACVASPQAVRALPFDDFRELLDVEVEEWYQQALTLNPHWRKRISLDREEAEDKNWDMLDWLRSAYDNPKAGGDVMPDFDELTFMFGRMSDELTIQAQKILSVLELTEFRWTIEDVLQQPEELLNAVFYMKSIGEKMRAQTRNKTNPT